MDNDKLNNNDTIEQLKRDFTVIRLNEELGLNSYGTEEPRRVYGALIEDLRKYMQGCHALRIYYTVGQCTFSYQCLGRFRIFLSALEFEFF